MHDNNYNVIVQKNVGYLMKRLAENLRIYLAEVTGQNIAVNQRDSGNLPYFLSQRYALYNLKVGSVLFTALFLKDGEGFKPVQFKKHLSQIPGIDLDCICVVAEVLPSYVRKRMIEKGIPFVIPKVQMFLPRLGMELRPRAGGKKNLNVESFSPATQVVLIYELLGKLDNVATPLSLSKQLGYSTMTMSRALDELETAKIGQVERVGRERLLSFAGSRKMIWQDAKPLLQNPISYVVRIFENELKHRYALSAGISALSSWTMLAEPDYPEYAISRSEWKKMEQDGVENIPMEEPGTCMLQVWRYDPKVLENNGRVDPFSLYLSLQNEADERVEMAMEELMGQYL